MVTQVSDEEYRRYCEARGLSPDPASYTTMELLAIAVARNIPDGAFMFAGTGLPLLGSMLALHTSAPGATLIMEAGIVGPTVEHLPISVSDPRGCLRGSTVTNMADTFGTTAQRGYCTLGILGAAECDRYGNLNSTAIGEYWPGGVSSSGRGPKVRFAGSGGANNIASLADMTIVMMVMEDRRFPEKVQYRTSVAGNLGPPGETKADYGLPRGGPCVMISDLCIMRNDPPKDNELKLEMIYPGVELGDVLENVSWELRTVDGKKATARTKVKVMDPPAHEELKILRTIVDPERIYLGRKSRRELARESKA
ncbi:MAG: CoA-transferase subunit beta [Nitrospinota bacterium]